MRLKEIYKEILSLDNLHPSPKVDKLFTQLVGIATDYTDDKLTQSQIKKLQKICSKVEYNLEKHWADIIIKSKNPQEEIKKFPYFKNYKDLTKLEWYSLQACQSHPNHNVLFVGSGPLPMTAIVLALDFNVSSTLIDIDKEAVDISKELIKSLKLENMIKVKHAYASTYEDYGQFNMIYIAALAGSNEKDKNAIFKKIKANAQKDIHLLARTTWGNRKLLYMPLSKKIFKFFKPIIKVDPYNEIVNSVFILGNYD